MLASLGNKIGLEPQLRYHGITLGAHTTDGCVSGSSLTTRHVQRSNPPRPRIHPAWKQFGGLQSFQVNHLLKSMGFLFIGKKILIKQLTLVIKHLKIGSWVQMIDSFNQSSKRSLCDGDIRCKKTQGKVLVGFVTGTLKGGTTQYITLPEN